MCLNKTCNLGIRTAQHVVRRNIIMFTDCCWNEPYELNGLKFEPKLPQTFSDTHKKVLWKK